MRNKIPCSAERLGLLDPQMIQAVSEPSAFQIAEQYLAQNRVRIVDAADAQITSAVIGNSGLYEQTIRLKDGHLLSKCSCTLPEEPMCRHCIAVLLEYHRWSQPKSSRKPDAPKRPKNSPLSAVPVSEKAPESVPSVTDMKLSDVMQFMEWLPTATRAIKAHEQLPDSPKFDSAEVSTWTLAICQLAEDRRESDQANSRLKAELRDREVHERRLTQELQTSIDEGRTTQATVEELRQEIATYKETLAKVAELANDIVTYEEEMRVAASDLLEKGSQLDKLAGSVKQVAQALKAAVNPTRPGS